LSALATRLSRVALLLLVVLGPLNTGYSKTTVKNIDAKSAAVFYNREIYFEITALSNSEFNKNFSDDVSIESKDLRTYKKKNGFKFRKNVYRFKFQHLTENGKRKVLKALFPKDKLTPAGWEHRIIYTGRKGETLWRISEWFTGTGTNSEKIQKINRLNPQKLGKGTLVVIPRDLLISTLQDKISYPITEGDLTFRQDSAGIFGEYTLRKGQTIYSGVVLRFTPRVTAQEVMQAAKIILKRTKLKNFRSIPANKRLKIPIELISPQFLPPDHPLRSQYDKTTHESLKYQKQSLAKRLEGVTIILDSGHGGIDPGALGPKGEKEDEYAYDVMTRVKLLLETGTEATVHATIKDDEIGFKPRSDSYLKSGKNREKVLTHPPYLIQNTRIALNLRWMLANYHFEAHLKSKKPTDKCIFVSFHMDSLHRNAKGLMVYIPGADFYKGQCNIKSSVYLRRSEAKGRNKVSMNRKDRLRAEGFSRSFARTITDTCHEHNLQMHSNQPIRQYIIRKRDPWVPAILKYCLIPTRILVELANLQNNEDRLLVRDPDYRQKLAEMFVDSLLKYFEKSG